MEFELRSHFIGIGMEFELRSYYIGIGMEVELRSHYIGTVPLCLYTIETLTVQWLVIVVHHKYIRNL